MEVYYVLVFLSTLKGWFAMKTGENVTHPGVEFVTKRVFCFRPILYLFVLLSCVEIYVFGPMIASESIFKGPLSETIWSIVAILAVASFAILTLLIYLLCFFDAIDRALSKQGSVSASLELILYLCVEVAGILWLFNLTVNTQGAIVYAIITILAAIALFLQIRYFFWYKSVMRPSKTNIHQ